MVESEQRYLQSGPNKISTSGSYPCWSDSDKMGNINHGKVVKLYNFLLFEFLNEVIKVRYQLCFSYFVEHPERVLEIL